MFLLSYFFFFKQKTAYEMRISDWSSDVCSSDLIVVVLVLGLHDWRGRCRRGVGGVRINEAGDDVGETLLAELRILIRLEQDRDRFGILRHCEHGLVETFLDALGDADRSEEHTSELQSLMRISNAVCCLKK